MRTSKRLHLRRLAMSLTRFSNKPESRSKVDSVRARACTVLRRLHLYRIKQDRRKPRIPYAMLVALRSTVGVVTDDACLVCLQHMILQYRFTAPVRDLYKRVHNLRTLQALKWLDTSHD